MPIYKKRQQAQNKRERVANNKRFDKSKQHWLKEETKKRNKPKDNKDD